MRINYKVSILCFSLLVLYFFIEARTAWLKKHVMSRCLYLNQREPEHRSTYFKWINEYLPNLDQSLIEDNREVSFSIYKIAEVDVRHLLRSDFSKHGHLPWEKYMRNLSFESKFYEFKVNYNIQASLQKKADEYNVTGVFIDMDRHLLVLLHLVTFRR